MAKADFKCEDCGFTKELPLPEDGRVHICGGCDGYMNRVWGPVHLGRMSSGEPPR